jgi:hypothetical protein
MQLDWQLKFCPILLIKEGESVAEGEKDETDDDKKTKTKNIKRRRRIRRLRRGIYDDLDLNSPTNSDVK